MCLLAQAGVLSSVTPANAVSVAQDRVVDADPVDWTPHVLDGSVKAIVEAGDRMVVGGTFTRVTNADGTGEVMRSNVFAFDRRTGLVDPGFAPVLDGPVDALAVAADGVSVYIGGGFSYVDGVLTRRIAHLNLSDGSPVAGFRFPPMNGLVRDFRLSGDRLFVSGTWTRIAGLDRPALVALDARTGKVDPSLTLAVAGPRNGGSVSIDKMDLSPDGSRLIVIGNFSSVAGLTRHQVAVLDVATRPSRVTEWSTDRYQVTCARAFDTYMRDVEYSPDGGYFVIVTTGAYRSGTLCDTAARWEALPEAAQAEPTWVDSTGGDTLYSVAVTGTAVYIGGHHRYTNNSFGNNVAAAGAVPREGIAALDPVNGLPLSWDPGRARGVGAFDLVATEDGLWIGSDTDRLGGWEYHGRLGLFPLATGTPIPPAYPGELPGEVHLVGAAAGGTGSVVKRPFDGTTPQPGALVPADGTNWDRARGAFMLSGTVYSGLSNGTFTARTYDGASFGPASTVNLYGLTAFASDLQSVTGMFFQQGRLYYTVSGSSRLYYRYFTAESQVVGAVRFDAGGSLTDLDWRTASASFLDGEDLYVADANNGNLRRVTFRAGSVVPGTVTTVSGPGLDGGDWRARGMFVLAEQGYAPNEGPVAELSASCAGLRCTLDGSGSSDPDGSIASYAWDLGDGSSADGPIVDHRYGADGDYTITLAVTDDDGATSSTSRQVTVANEAPVASFTQVCSGLSCSFDASGTADADGEVVSYEWDFGDGGVGGGVAVSHEYTGSGVFAVRLTVADDAGARHTVVRDVDVRAVEPVGDVAFVAADNSNGNARVHRVTVPVEAAGGDAVLLFVTLNSTVVTMDGPSGVTGWSLLDTVSGAGVVTTVWTKVAEAGDAGEQVSIGLSGYAKAAMTVMVYSGTDPVSPVAAHAGAVEVKSGTEHRTPGVTVAEPGSWVVSYWADRNAGTTAWIPPAMEVIRQESYGSGNARVSALVTDSGQAVTTGERAGLTATSDVATVSATMWSVVLTPQS